MYIDKNNPLPVYLQLKNLILKRIEDGEYEPESLIPSEREISESLKISRMTVRQALNQLVDEGVLYREKGKGTFVSKSKFEQRNIMSFSELVRSRGLVPSTKVLKNEIIYPDEFLLKELNLSVEEPICNIKRLRYAGSIPVGIEEVFIPERYCPGIENYDLTSSLYKILKHKYYHNIKYVDSTIEAGSPSKEEMTLLEIKSNIPVLTIISSYYSDKDVKLFYEKSSYRSDEYKYSVRVF